VFIIFNKPADGISENGLLDHSSSLGGCPLPPSPLWLQNGRSGASGIAGNVRSSLSSGGSATVWRVERS